MKKARKRCKLGKSCAATCISKNKRCKSGFSAQVNSSVYKMRDYVKKHGVHVAEHGAKGVIAWKAGKVLAPAVSGFLETHYGIPREASGRMAETVIQAVTATALEAKHLKDVDTFVKKLVTETAAAYLGKAAHGGLETALDAAEAAKYVQLAAPTLAGKVTGITTAALGGKLPTPGSIIQGIIQRSKDDTNKLIEMVRPKEVAFAEENFDGIVELLADIAVAALLEMKG